jgi:hypothetical protein
MVRFSLRGGQIALLERTGDGWTHEGKRSTPSSDSESLLSGAPRSGWSPDR